MMAMTDRERLLLLAFVTLLLFSSFLLWLYSTGR
jgi:hypothetical protein